MKNKIFSGGIYREDLRRLKAFTVIMAAIVLLFEMVPPILEGISHAPGSSKTEADFDTICLTVPFICIFCSIAAVMLVFSQFNKRSYSDFAHSLPYTRTCIFFSKTAAVYTCIFFLYALAAVSGLLVYSAFSNAYVVNLTGFIPRLLKYISASAFVVSCFSIATAITGTVLSNITAAGLIMFFPRFVCFLMTEAVTYVLPFMCGGSYLPLLSPRYNTFISLLSLGSFFYTDSFPQIAAPIIYTFIIALIYTAIALILFKKRKSETAEMPAPGRGVQCAIRVLIALVFSLPATVICAVDSTDFDLSIILYVLALIAYFAYEIITVKSWKSLVRAIPALGIVVLINLITLGTYFGIITVAGNFTPTANETESVRLTSDAFNFIGGNENDYYSIAAESEIKDLKVKAAVTNALCENVKAWNDATYDKYYSEKYPYNLCFGIKTGVFTRYRMIYLNEEEYKTIIEGISNNETYKKVYMELPERIKGTLEVLYQYSIPEKGEQEIIDTLQKEITAQGFEKWYSLCRGEHMEETDSLASRSLTISYSVRGYSGIKLCAPVNSVLCPETFELLMKYSMTDSARRDFDIIIERMEKNPTFINDDDLDMWINIYDGKKVYYYSGSEKEINFEGNFTANDEITALLKEAANGKYTYSADRYMEVSINMFVYDDNRNYEDYSVTVYLPLPDDFRIGDYPEFSEDLSASEPETVYYE